MKRGIEVEGVHYGQDSLFMDWREYFDLQHLLARVPREVAFYISDHGCRLNWMQVINDNRDRIVTLEVEHIPRQHYHNALRLDRVGNPNFRIMWNISDDGAFTFEQFDALRPEDQIKISTGLDVICTTAGNFTRTRPADFDGDRVIDLKQEFNI